MKIANYKVPVLRCIFSAIIAFILFIGIGMAGSAVYDDLAVMSLNNPEPNRLMIAYEQNRSVITFSNIGILILCGVYTIGGFKKC